MDLQLMLSGCEFFSLSDLISYEWSDPTPKKKKRAASLWAVSLVGHHNVLFYITTL